MTALRDGPVILIASLRDVVLTRGPLATMPKPRWLRPRIARVLVSTKH